MQGLGEQRREPLSEDNLVAAYTGTPLCRVCPDPHARKGNVLLRCTPFSRAMSRNHLGYLHAHVRVVNNAWTDDVGDEAMELLFEAIAEAEVQPPLGTRSNTESRSSLQPARAATAKKRGGHPPRRGVGDEVSNVDPPIHTRGPIFLVPQFHCFHPIFESKIFSF